MTNNNNNTAKGFNAPKVRPVSNLATAWGKFDAQLVAIDKTNVNVYTKYAKLGVLVASISATYKRDGDMTLFYAELEARGWKKSTADLYATIGRRFDKSEHEREADAAVAFVTAVNEGDYKLNANEFSKFLAGKASKASKAKVRELFKVTEDANGKQVISGELAELEPAEQLAALQALLGL